MAWDVRPSTWASRTVRVDGIEVKLSDLLDRHLPDCAVIPFHSELAAELDDTAEAATLRDFSVWVPSASRPGAAYRVGVHFHPPTADAPEGYVTAGHELFGCPAHDNHQRCWHLDCGLAAVVREYAAQLPNHGRISERPRPLRQAEPEPTPEPVHRPTGTDPWGLD